MIDPLKVWRESRPGVRRSGAIEAVIGRVTASEPDPMERLVRLLRCCGYLAERRPEGVIIGDNAHPADRDDFAALSPMGPDALDRIPWAGGLARRSFDSSFYASKGHFLRRAHGHKVPAYALDGMVAYLVKALSAAGVFTTGSCDGHGGPNVYIGLEDGCNSAWAATLIRTLEASWRPFDADWEVVNGWLWVRSDGDLVRLYTEVLDVADRLYARRLILRECRRRVVDGLDARVESWGFDSILLHVDLLARLGPGPATGGRDERVRCGRG